MNLTGVKSIYVFEMARARRTLWQSLVAPVITTSLYFLVFGTADVPLAASLAVMAGAILIPLVAITWIFRTGYRLKN